MSTRYYYPNADGTHQLCYAPPLAVEAMAAQGEAVAEVEEEVFEDEDLDEDEEDGDDDDSDED